MHNMLKVNKFLLLSVMLWTILLGISLFWNIIHQRSHILDLATISARENFNKDQAFRLWGSRHGGVYVPPNKRTPPNPALAHLPDRDITTTKGKKLTLMNPAFMLRQMMNEYDELYGIKAKITGRVLLNPINAADDWELKALGEFEKGTKEIKEQSEINGLPYLRLMRPMIMKQSCMKCHGHLGFKVGDIRGGVGVAIPLTPYIKNSANSVTATWIYHAGIWVFGVLALIILDRSNKQQNKDKQRRLALEQEVLQADKENEAKSEFLSRMSHELRTPLNAILGFGQLLEIKAKNFNDTDNRNVKEILDAGNHLLNLINEVLDIAKVESGNLDIEIERVDVKNVIDECVSLMKNAIKDKNISLIINEEGTHYFVNADFLRLKQILLNLLSNATKYNKTNGQIKIHYKLVNDNRICICVSDTGDGLSEEQISKVFSPFERLDIKENIEGTGIGLTISKHLIELMGGAIGIDSTIGKGTTLWIELNLSTQKGAE